MTADAGWVRLTGYVLPNEKQALVAAIRHVPGIVGIQNELDDHGWLQTPQSMERACSRACDG